MAKIEDGIVGEMDRGLELLLGLLERAVDSAVKPGMAEAESHGTSSITHVYAFNEMFRLYRLLGGMAVDNLNRVLASKSHSKNRGSMVKSYLRLDAICEEHGDGGTRTATVAIPLDELKPYIPVKENGFVDADSPEVREGVRRYLREHATTLNERIYSHLDEPIGLDSRVKCEKHYAEFSPTAIMRAVVEQVSKSEEKEREAAIIAAFAKALKAQGIISAEAHSDDDALAKRLREDLVAILDANGKGYRSLYSAFEHTRFTLAVLEDAARLTRPQHLEVLKCFETPRNGRENRNDRKKHSHISFLLEKKKGQVIEALEKAVARHIKPPYEVFMGGVKQPESFAFKFLLAKMHQTIRKGYEEGTLNAYLQKRGFPALTEDDLRPRDLRDLFRMSWIVHGNLDTYLITKDCVPLQTPREEELAQQKVYNSFFEFAGISQNLRGSNISNGRIRGNQDWRRLGEVRTNAGAVINLSSTRDVRDYILVRKPNGFAEIKAYVVYDGMGYEVPIELKFRTNYMDNLNEVGREASHEIYKRRNSAMIDYCIEMGAIERGRVDATIRIVKNALGR